MMMQGVGVGVEVVVLDGTLVAVLDCVAVGSIISVPVGEGVAVAVLVAAGTVLVGGRVGVWVWAGVAV